MIQPPASKINTLTLFGTTCASSSTTYQAVLTTSLLALLDRTSPAGIAICWVWEMSCEIPLGPCVELTAQLIVPRDAVPPDVLISYTKIIDSILASSDLNTISEKRIRKGLQDVVGHDITPQKVGLSVCAI